MSNWMPYDWSINNVVMGEAVHAALRDRAHLGSGDGHEIGGERERLPVEVAVRLDRTVLEDSHSQAAAEQLQHRAVHDSGLDTSMSAS